MNNDLIKEFAEQAGLGTKSNESWSLLPIDQHSLERFAELVRQDERETCAKLCEELSNHSSNPYTLRYTAIAIRGRTE
jgi:hypothetical protein